MKPFIQIAQPHQDILEGRLTMDVFAADLWQVVQGQAPLDYKDKDLFLKKTYITKGLKEILNVAKRRLEGKSGDSVIQLQTPFGGGKTHTLIALYHIAKEWPAKIVVFDGTALNPKETKPWEELERQLTGSCEITKGDIAPGKEKLIKIISESSPLLILMDEILEYTTKAAGVKVGDSNLASQTLAFMQELSGAVSTVGNSLLVITLPSSVSEHYDDETSEKLFRRLAKITGRIEKIYTPVGEDEIEHVIRRRLFQNVNEREVKKVVDEVVSLAERGGLLSGDEVGEYRERFLRSFPFKPEVIDVLYKRWGSFPTFQRTRGVLRLLSLVIHDLMDKQLPFIRLGDFNLQNEEIKRELIKHIGQEWDSIIAQDITSKDSGAKKVDESIESTYKPYKLGSVVSATIFMLSFSGRGERGTSVREIKLSTFHPDFQTPVIDTVINQLRDRLFYLSDEGLFFTNQPNLNKIILTREENVTLEKIVYEERELIEKSISRERRFLVYIWPQNHKDIPDTSDLKLIILKDTYPEKEFIERHGENPRVYRNILIFLCPEEDQREYFYKFIRRMLALRSIDEDQRLQLTENQDKEVKNKIKSQEIRFYEELRKYYRWVFIPEKDGFRKIDLGIPTVGEFSFLDSEVYHYLRNEEEILEKISPVVIRNKYLSDKDFVETKKILDAFWKTPGERRIVSSEAFKDSIREGVERGEFGLGYLEESLPVCRAFKEKCSPELDYNEVIIRAELCKPEEEGERAREGVGVEGEGEEGAGVAPGGEPGRPGVREGAPGLEQTPGPVYSKLNLKLNVPIGQLSTMVKVVNFLGGKFSDCKVRVEINATEGKVSVADYENKIEEALRQAGIKIEEEQNE